MLEATCSKMLRGFYEGEPLHRVWNDFKAGVKRMNYTAAVAKLTVLANLNQGPWQSADNLEIKREAVEHFLDQKLEDPEWVSQMSEEIAFDRGLPANASLDDVCFCMEAFMEARTFQVGGQRLKHKGFFAMTDCLEALDPEWTLIAEVLEWLYPAGSTAPERDAAAAEEDGDPEEARLC